MRKARRRCESPVTSERLVDGVFRATGLRQRAREWEALLAWDTVAPPRYREHTRGERYRSGTLLVRVRSAPLASELSFLRGQLLEQLRETPGGEYLQELRFTIGPLEDLPAVDASEPRWPAPPDPGPLPVVDDGQVAQALLQVADDDLRAALAELYARQRCRR